MKKWGGLIDCLLTSLGGEWAASNVKEIPTISQTNFETDHLGEDRPPGVKKLSHNNISFSRECGSHESYLHVNSKWVHNPNLTNALLDCDGCKEHLEESTLGRSAIAKLGTCGRWTLEKRAASTG